jgi:cyclic pyranopterin phosphate synthase
MGSFRPLVDSLGRHIDYLRISLTERCDLRCAYCRPGGEATGPEADLLTADDVVRIAQAGLDVGIRRIRLTGGEPLLRRDLEEIIARLSMLPGLRDLALTTNGQQLSRRAAALAAAGLMRVNISLDSLDAETYSHITGGGDVEAVVRGTEAALAARLEPVKVNVVLTAGGRLDDGGVLAFADFAHRLSVHVRFIEVMPTCVRAGYVPAGSVLDQLARSYDLRPVPGPDGGGPARYYQLGESLGTIGVIAPISDPFCSQCNRLRVSARGELKPCLFSPAAVDLVPALRARDPAARLKALLAEAAAAKPKRYADIAEPVGIRAMHVIGG